jgi:hypothetical protein
VALLTINFFRSEIAVGAKFFSVPIPLIFNSSTREGRVGIKRRRVVFSCCGKPVAKERNYGKQKARGSFRGDDDSVVFQHDGK